jgi:hypothetical protein
MLDDLQGQRETQPDFLPGPFGIALRLQQLAYSKRPQLLPRRYQDIQIHNFFQVLSNVVASFKLYKRRGMINLRFRQQRWSKAP